MSTNAKWWIGAAIVVIVILAGFHWYSTGNVF